MLWCARLSFGKEKVTFPRMNYRRKKISMKERLEEAIAEIGDEPLQGSGFERETPEERFSQIEAGAPGLASRTGQAQRRNAVQVCLR
jgi:hypothetical protein